MRVSWYDTVLFCNWLSRQEGLTPCYQRTGKKETKSVIQYNALQLHPEADGYRLPTEAEWEYACRAGTVTMFSHGNEESLLDRYAVFGSSQTELPASKLPNGWGLFDVNGNVSEWCHDWYGPYGNEAALSDPLGFSQGAQRVVRGGSWIYNSLFVKSATRDNVSDNHRGLTGFRVARNNPAAWVKGKGRAAKLHLPLKRVRIELGHTLITFHRQNKVIELDASGKQIWEKTGLESPTASTGLTNGHRLITSLIGQYVVEYDASGKEVWRKDGLPKHPLKVRRLENGNTLIACGESHKVVEIRPDGSTAWEILIDGWPMDVWRLESGWTLVTLQNGGRVVEVDRAGKVHWEIKGLNRPVAAQRLANGGTLVAEYGAGWVVERDRDGRIVWQHMGLQNPRSAERLSNGNTLIADHSGVREVDRQGKIIWQKQMTGVVHATRY